jgi:hypothetical protein
MEKDLECLGLVVAGFDAFEQSVEGGIAGESRHAK